MGLFDYVKVSDDRFKCSEGHNLCDEEFQTKDFDSVMGTISIINGKVTFHDGPLGPPEVSPFTGSADIYCDCRKCPAFVQAGTGNLAPCHVRFSVTIIGDIVGDVKRISMNTAEWLIKEPTLSYMANCEGPMPYEKARARHIHYPRPWDKK